MPKQEATGFCRSCNMQVMLRRNGTSHVFHLILTIITGGFG